MVSRNPRRPRSRPDGFSLIEMIIVLAIIGILAGLGAVSYAQFINRTRLASAADILASNLRQARQLAVATRIPHRVVFSVPEQEAQLDPLPEEVWIEKMETSQLAGRKGQDQWVEVSDPKRLPDGVKIVSFNGRRPGADGASTVYYAEFNFRGQMTKCMFSSDRTPTSMSLYIHLERLGEEVDPGVEGQRPLAHSVEVLRLTGRVRSYDYGYGYPFPTTEYRG